MQGLPKPTPNPPAAQIYMFPIEECLRRIPANSETARTTNEETFASSLLSVHEPPELTLLLPTA